MYVVFGLFGVFLGGGVVGGILFVWGGGGFGSGVGRGGGGGGL